MKKFNNQKLFYKWVKLILSIYMGDSFYYLLKRKEKNFKESELIKSFQNQIKLLKKRDTDFHNISIKDFKNYKNLYQFKIK